MERSQVDARPEKAVGRIRKRFGWFRGYVRKRPQPGAALDPVEKHPRKRARVRLACPNGIGEFQGAARMQGELRLWRWGGRGWLLSCRHTRPNRQSRGWPTFSGICTKVTSETTAPASTTRKNDCSLPMLCSQVSRYGVRPPSSATVRL